MSGIPLSTLQTLFLNNSSNAIGAVVIQEIDYIGEKTEGQKRRNNLAQN